MRKFSFVTAFILSGVISTSSLAQNYYDPGFYQNSNYGYQQRYSYPQNYGYYPQQIQQPTQYYSQTQNNMTPKQTKVKPQQKGVGTVSIGADYVLGYFSFESKEHNLGEIIYGAGDYIFDTNEFKDKSNAGAFNIGWRPFKYIGIEAFYISSLKDNQEESVLSNTYYVEFADLEKSVSYSAYGIDVIGYYPINDYIELIASIGVGKYDVEADVTITARDVGTSPGVIRSNSQTFEDSVTAYRIGGGFQLWLSKHIAFRVTGRWTGLGGEFADYITEVNMGIRYHF